MNFGKLSVLAVVVSVGALAGACHNGAELAPHHTECTTDVLGIEHCETHYYSADGSVETTHDMITDAARAEEILLERQGAHYATKFSLSAEQGMKIAKTVNDYNALQSRSDQDVADFAQRLYGLNPAKIVDAAGQAQAGDNTSLNQVVSEAAVNFNTTPENMKNIVKTLHGKLLQEQGIQL
jgi:t-SNARE complex subunit (syntaxin)